jgi:hypothetical protein
LFWKLHNALHVDRMQNKAISTKRCGISNTIWQNFFYSRKKFCIVIVDFSLVFKQKLKFWQPCSPYPIARFMQRSTWTLYPPGHGSTWIDGESWGAKYFFHRRFSGEPSQIMRRKFVKYLGTDCFNFCRIPVKLSACRMQNVWSLLHIAYYTMVAARRWVWFDISPVFTDFSSKK